MFALQVFSCHAYTKLCLKAGSTPEYLQLELKSGVVSGKILKEADGNKWLYSFKGNFISDTIIKVFVAYDDAELLEEWIIHFEKDRVTLTNSLERNETITYFMMDCGKMPADTEYASVSIPEDDMDSEDEHQSIIPDREIYLKSTNGAELKYIHLQIAGRNVKGEIFNEKRCQNFRGKMISATTLEIVVNYQNFEQWENWIIHLEKDVWLQNPEVTFRYGYDQITKAEVPQYASSCTESTFDNDKLMLPEKSCFKSNFSEEYIQLEFNENGEIKGQLLNREKSKRWIQGFTGNVICDVDVAQNIFAIKVNIAYQDAIATKIWLIDLDKNTMSLRESKNSSKLNYNSIGCDSMTRVLRYFNTNILGQQTNKIALLESDPTCYKFVPANPNKGNYYYEFFQLWNEDGRITGRGIGYFTGDAGWTFNFTGNQTSPTTLKVSVDLKKKKNKTITISETWVIDPQKHTIKVNSPNKDRNQLLYEATECENFINFAHDEE